MKTYCIAEMKFIDVTALSDASPATENNQTIGNLEVLAEQTAQDPYGTLELNQFVLDGSKSILPEAPADVAFWSSEMSQSDCTFASNPVMEISFTKQHSSAGLTLHFADDYPAEIMITWYTLAGTKLESKTFYPDSLIYVCQHQVENYGKIVIELARTRLPERYVKLQYILYGLELSWKDDVVQKAKVQEEVDLTSATLSINTAEVAIVDTANDFDISNMNGAWKSVQKGQEVTLTEYKDGKEIPAGTFFIDKSSFKDNVASFSLTDRIGLMDKYTFYDGEVYQNVLAGIILESIFACAGVEKYSIDEAIYNIPLSGHLGIQTCRAALQMVCFACGALADDSRSDMVKVYKPDRYVKATIGTDRKFYGGTKVELDEYVSGVSIECNRYSLEAETTEIYNDILAAGDTKIEFSEPYLATSITVSVGAIKEAKTNYMIVTMEEAGTCLISGRKYASNSFSYQKDVAHIAAGEVENVKKYGTCTLCNTESLPDNAQYLLDYHALRKTLSMKYLLEGEQSGNWVNVNDRERNTSTTIIEKQSIDLTGGFIAQATCRGYSIVVTENNFTGTELYSGGGALL